MMVPLPSGAPSPLCLFCVADEIRTAPAPDAPQTGTTPLLAGPCPDGDQ